MDKNTLYIILFILFMIWNIYRSNKKKQEMAKKKAAEAASKRETAEQGDELQDMMKKIFGDEMIREERPAMEVTPPPAPEPRPRYESFDQDIPLTEKFGSLEDLTPWVEEEQKEERAIDEIADNVQFLEMVEKVESDEENDFKSELEDFDLRKAVIYSTILDRPYS